MSLITEILDRLSGVAVLKTRLAETNRNVDRSLTWLLDHEKRLMRLEMTAPGAHGGPAPLKAPRLPPSR